MDKPVLPKLGLYQNWICPCGTLEHPPNKLKHISTRSWNSKGFLTSEEVETYWVCNKDHKVRIWDSDLQVYIPIISTKVTTTKE